MLKFIVKLVVSAAITYATWHVGSAYVSYYKLKDATEQAALTPRLTDLQLRDRVLQLAEENDAPLDADHLEIRRDNRHIVIEASYVNPIEILPGFVYPWRFAWSVEALVIPGAVAPSEAR